MGAAESRSLASTICLNDEASPPVPSQRRPGCRRGAHARGRRRRRARAQSLLVRERGHGKNEGFAGAHESRGEGEAAPRSGQARAQHPARAGPGSHASQGAGAAQGPGHSRLQLRRDRGGSGFRGGRVPGRRPRSLHRGRRGDARRVQRRAAEPGGARSCQRESRGRQLERRGSDRASGDPPGEARARRKRRHHRARPARAVPRAALPRERLPRDRSRPRPGQVRARGAEQRRGRLPPGNRRGSPPHAARKRRSRCRCGVAHRFDQGPRSDRARRHAGTRPRPGDLPRQHGDRVRLAHLVRKGGRFPVQPCDGSGHQRARLFHARQ